MLAPERFRLVATASLIGGRGAGLRLALLLALALAFGQQHAALHWLGHAIQQVSAAKAAPAGGTLVQPHCDDCGAAASFVGAVAPDVTAWRAPRLAQHDERELDMTVSVPPPWLAYRSRAPPARG